MSLYSGIYLHWEGTETDANIAQEIRELVFLDEINALRFKDCDSNYHYFYDSNSGLWQEVNETSPDRSGIIYQGTGFVGIGSGISPLTKLHVLSSGYVNEPARTIQMELISNSGDISPEITLYHDNESGNPSSGFLIGTINYKADNDANTVVNYARTRAIVTDPAENSEKAKYTIDIAQTGSGIPETIVEVKHNEVNISGDLKFHDGSGSITVDSEWFKITSHEDIASGTFITSNSYTKISVDSGDILIGSDVDDNRIHMTNNDLDIYHGGYLQASSYFDMNIGVENGDLNLTSDVADINIISNGNDVYVEADEYINMFSWTGLVFESGGHIDISSSDGSIFMDSLGITADITGDIHLGANEDITLLASGNHPSSSGYITLTASGDINLITDHDVFITAKGNGLISSGNVVFNTDDDVYEEKGFMSGNFSGVAYITGDIYYKRIGKSIFINYDFIAESQTTDANGVYLDLTKYPSLLPRTTVASMDFYNTNIVNVTGVNSIGDTHVTQLTDRLTIHRDYVYGRSWPSGEDIVCRGEIVYQGR